MLQLHTILTVPVFLQCPGLKALHCFYRWSLEDLLDFWGLFSCSCCIFWWSARVRIFDEILGILTSWHWGEDERLATNKHVTIDVFFTRWQVGKTLFSHCECNSRTFKVLNVLQILRRLTQPEDAKDEVNKDETQKHIYSSLLAGQPSFSQLLLMNHI